MFNENVNPIGREANHIFSQSECSLVADPGFWPWPLLQSNTLQAVLLMSKGNQDLGLFLGVSNQTNGIAISIQNGIAISIYFNFFRVY